MHLKSPHDRRPLAMSELTILFGRPERPDTTDDRFEIEVLAAEELGIESYALPLDPVVNGEPERALRRLPRARDRRWVYRGWMLSEDEYTRLYEAICDHRSPRFHRRRKFA